MSKVTGMFYKLQKHSAATPLPCRVGGGVSIFFAVRMLQTPPLPLPLMGGEWLRSVFCRLNHGFDFLKWAQLYNNGFMSLDGIRNSEAKVFASSSSSLLSGIISSKCIII